MEFLFGSGASTQTHSLSRSSTSSDISTDSVGTPDTNRSVLFEEAVDEQLNLTEDDSSYILVVGGLGFIGSHTTLELLKEGYNVVVIDDLSNSYRNVLERVEHLAAKYYENVGGSLPALKFHEVDYKSPYMRTILAGYDQPNRVSPLTGRPVSRIKGVIHFAAFKSVEESINSPLPYYQNNVCGMVNFLMLLGEFGIKNFVFSSSATVYGSMANRGIPLREEHCVHELERYEDSNGMECQTEPGVFGLTSPYGRTKWMCEAILADLAKSDPSWMITALRYFNPVGCHESGLLGEDPRQKPTNLVPVLVKVLTGAKPELEIFGSDWETPDGTAVRDFIHVVDLARGHIAALSAAANGAVRQPFRTFNLGTGRGHTVREVLQSIEKASSLKVPVREVGRRPGDVGSCVAEVRRAEAELGWKTEKHLDTCAVDVWNFTQRAGQAAPAQKEDSQTERLQIT